MDIIINPDKKNWNNILERPQASDEAISGKVIAILEDVKKNGDDAVRKYSKRFDGISLGDFAVSKDELAAAENLISTELKSALQIAAANIRKFHEKQVGYFDPVETMPGIKCWQRSVAIEKIGFYIPGGSAPLFSTVLMLGIPAQIAGSKEIVLCTPPSRDGTICPAILYAAQLCGIRNIYKVGGAQAIAAMAYGTETIPKSYKIFGPGNRFVTLAKQLVQQDGVGIDMPAGPSELLVFADETALPEFVAADLLSQAEHGPDSQVILLTNLESIAKRVGEEVTKQLEKLPRKEIAIAALENSKAIIINDHATAIELINEYAPEHLIIACKNAESVANNIINAGSVFLGNYSPESAGDYASGTNHVLPTNGYARSYSGVNIESFIKKITYQQLTKEGLQNISDTVIEMAAAEGLEAHKNAITVRLKK